MTDQNDPLESELAGMSPQSLDSDLTERIEAAVNGPKNSPWADRMLVGAMAAGSLAACVIAVLLSIQTYSPPIRSAQIAMQEPTIGSYTLALAQDGDDLIAAKK